MRDRPDYGDRQYRRIDENARRTYCCWTPAPLAHATLPTTLLVIATQQYFHALSCQ